MIVGTVALILGFCFFVAFVVSMVIIIKKLYTNNPLPVDLPHESGDYHLEIKGVNPLNGEIIAEFTPLEEWKREHER